MRVYVLVNDDPLSSSYKDPIAVYISQRIADKDQEELRENGEKVLMLVLDTED